MRREINAKAGIREVKLQFQIGSRKRLSSRRELRDKKRDKEKKGDFVIGVQIFIFSPGF
jgi:hypothetical protein